MGSSGSDAGILLVILVAFVLIYVRLRNPSDVIEVIEGSAIVEDADGLRINEDRIRLFGIDALEKNQPWTDSQGIAHDGGDIAREALEERIGDSNVKCVVKDIDIYERKVCQCFVNDEDINKWMVRNGHAVAIGNDYWEDENQARSEKLGIWAGSFDHPKTFRDLQKLGQS